MKQLTNDHTTSLEHIAPHHCSTVEFNKYTQPVIVQNVVHRSLFNRGVILVIPGIYPHDIAYHNLLASCNSKSHCNHHRDNNFINCFFYDHQITHKVLYDSEGNVFSSEYIEDLETIGISINQLLIVFRKIWYELAKTKESVGDVLEDDILEVVAEITISDKFPVTINDFWGSPSKISELMKYKWFFEYYKNQLNNKN
ncbi:MAG: hypothetical protein IPI65_16985 [Bacteroidetes bacterium]|nr:hypothetical protein [Bacteroidota bacterium]